MSTTKFPKVGVAVILRREQYILIGERISSLGKDTWGLPGGKLDFGEDLIDGAVREVFEETGIEINPISLSLVATTSAIFDEETH
jgi:8-oxo-dGTP diphosphatase